MTNASTAAIERSCANRPHAGIGPWNAELPIPTPITVTAYTAGAARTPGRPASVRARSSTPASTYARLDSVLAGCAIRPRPMCSQSDSATRCSAVSRPERSADWKRLRRHPPPSCTGPTHCSDHRDRRSSGSFFFGVYTPIPSGYCRPAPMISGGCGWPFTNRIRRTVPSGPGPMPSLVMVIPMSA